MFTVSFGSGAHRGRKGKLPFQSLATRTAAMHKLADLRGQVAERQQRPMTCRPTPNYGRPLDSETSHSLTRVSIGSKWVDGPRKEMDLSDLLRSRAAHPSDDPLTARLVEVIECEMASLEDDLETAEDRREEAERALSEAQARVTRLESALDDEGVDEKRWR